MSLIMNSKLLKLLLVAFLVFVSADSDDLDSDSDESEENVFKTVKTTTGSIRGRLNQTLLIQRDYFAFKGIPFAKPPLRELRFKAPEPIEPWSTTLNAFQYAPACPQLDDEILFRDTREDCLYLNVFVPVVHETEKLPVLIFIFGGGFTKGTSDDTIHGPDFLLEQRIIYVTISYRIGVLGFMSLGTPEYSGNMGLKDQAMGIKWVYENIEAFGGDKSRITLSGHSAGAMSVGHHFLHHETKNYFQQFICMSGTAVTATSYENGDHRCLMELLASYTKPVQNTDELIQFLQNAPVKEFMKLTYVTKSPVDPIWAPIVENENAISPYIPRDPLEQLESLSSINKTAYFTFTNREVLGFAPEGFPDMKMIDDFLDDFGIVLPIHGYEIETTKKPYLKDLMDDVYNFYFANATTDFERADQVLVLLSDLLVVYSIEEWLVRHVAISKKNTFYHRFSVDTILNVAKEVDFPGAGHDDEACYLFNCRRFTDYYQKIHHMEIEDENSAIVTRTTNYMTKLVSNFVKYGRPSVNGIPVKGFIPVQNHQLNFLDITNDGLTVGKTPNGNRTKFLEYIVKETKRRVDFHFDTPLQTDPERRCMELMNHTDKVPSYFMIFLSIKFITLVTILSVLCALLIVYIIRSLNACAERRRLISC